MKKIFLMLLLLSLCLAGCTSSHKPVSQSGFLLDTVINITLYSTHGEKQSTALLEKSFQLLEKYEQMFSRTISGSDISRINAARGKSVEVSSETITLLERALSFCELSNGNFDITIAPLSTLWDFKNKKEKPSSSDIEKAQKLVDYHTIILKENTVMLKNPDAAIDLGGIAKGYIADKIKDYLISEGVESALINLGGNVLTIGKKPDGTLWNVGIQKPFGEQNESITSVHLNGNTLVTSGIYERYFEQGGDIYHHILNPKTGYPYKNNLYSVSILTDSSADADALSTTCFALGLEEGMELIEELDGTEALFITDDNKLHRSSGFPE